MLYPILLIYYYIYPVLNDMFINHYYQSTVNELQWRKYVKTLRISVLLNELFEKTDSLKWTEPPIPISARSSLLLFWNWGFLRRTWRCKCCAPVRTVQFYSPNIRTDKIWFNRKRQVLKCGNCNQPNLEVMFSVQNDSFIQCFTALRQYV